MCVGSGVEREIISVVSSLALVRREPTFLRNLYLSVVLLLSLCTRRRAGNKFFKAGDYRNAIAKYSDAIAADPTNHTYWSNRRC